MASNGERKSRRERPSTDEQIVTILREADKVPVAEDAKKHANST
jgi:hypothetical protein